MKSHILLLLLLMCVVTSCGNWKIQGTDEIPDEDWENYDYVFEGDSPDPNGDPMFFKINIDENGLVDGETLGVFYAQFAGTLADQAIFLEMEYIDHRCEMTAYATFNGTFTENELIGTIQVSACEIWQYIYQGVRVGGSH